ncbi:MAG TPA: hypothetical protein V6C85_01415, partial [Allocoleopsis sp.]
HSNRFIRSKPLSRTCYDFTVKFPFLLAWVRDVTSRTNPLSPHPVKSQLVQSATVHQDPIGTSHSDSTSDGRKYSLSRSDFCLGGGGE